jgi:two-component system, LytTR family, sensor kinase
MMQMFRNKYRYIFIIILAVYSYANSLLSDVYSHYNINAPAYDILLVFFLITFLVWEGNRLIGHALKAYKPEDRPVRLLVIFFIAGSLFSTLISLVVTWLIGSVVIGIPVSALKMPAILAFTYGTRINLFLHILNAVFFYINQYNNKQLEAEELKRINTQAQLQSIKNQINPHFLFNNLNVLSSMVMRENPEANQFIEEFSKVYRHVLNSQQRELIPLKEELEFIKPYLFLLEKRFPDSIFIETDIPSGFEEYLIVPVSVQMLIENAIKHNIVSRTRPLRIRIAVQGDDRLLVSNNLQLKSTSEPSTQIGLNNINQRYEIITGRKIETKKSETDFSVFIPLIQAGT